MPCTRVALSSRASNGQPQNGFMHALLGQSPMHINPSPFLTLETVKILKLGVQSGKRRGNARKTRGTWLEMQGLGAGVGHPARCVRPALKETAIATTEIGRHRVT